MEYRLPTIEDELALREYVTEHHENDENSVSASMGLPAMEYQEWVEMIHKNATIGNEEWGKSLLYLCIDHKRIVGLLSIRYDLSAKLSNQYGDIGYGVRPSERRKGYATKMLSYALSVCRSKNMNQVILGCYKDNIASAATIIKNGGVLLTENDNYHSGRISQYYTIRL